MQKESDPPWLGLAHRKGSDSADHFCFRKFRVSVVWKKPSHCKHNALQIQVLKTEHSLKQQKPQRYKLVYLLVYVKLKLHKMSLDNKKKTPQVKPV